MVLTLGQFWVEPATPIGAVTVKAVDQAPQSVPSLVDLLEPASAQEDRSDSPLVLIKAIQGQLRVRYEWDFGARARPQGHIFVAGINFLVHRP